MSPPPTNAQLPTDQDIQNTIALDNDPLLRNLKITQGYHDLNEGMTSLTGGRNLSWCGFASWSSKTIGRFLRDASLRPRARQSIAQHPRYRAAIADIVRILPALGPPLDDPFDNVIDDALQDAIDNLKQGNVEVYREIGLLYSRIVSTVGNDSNMDISHLDPILALLNEQPSEQGGQKLLRQAAENYYRARFAPGGRPKAQLVLLANAQIGWHEQMALQTHIEGFLGGPLKQRIIDFCQRACGGHRPLEELVDPFARGFGEMVKSAWVEFATAELLELDMPDQKLRLGRDVPPAQGKATVFPDDLQNIDDPDTLTILRRFEADGPNADGTASNDWSKLEQRMRYILVLFRSRQLEGSLLNQPFSDSQRTDIAAGRMPAPPPPL